MGRERDFDSENEEKDEIIRTSRGKDGRARVNLRDGRRVTLGPSSRLDPSQKPKVGQRLIVNETRRPLGETEVTITDNRREHITSFVTRRSNIVVTSPADRPSR